MNNDALEQIHADYGTEVYCCTNADTQPNRFARHVGRLLAHIQAQDAEIVALREGRARYPKGK